MSTSRLLACLLFLATVAADAFGQQPATKPPSAAALIEQVQTGNYQRQAEAVAQMIDVADADVAKVVPALIKAMDSPFEEVRAAARLTLPRLAPRAAGAVPVLSEIALSDNVLDARTAIAMLREIGPAAKDAVPTLIKLLDSEDFHTQYWSCRALGSIGSAAEPALPKLIELTTKGVTSVRGNAASALVDIAPNGSKPIIDTLIVALDDISYSVRSRAAVALGKLGPAATKAAEPLKTRMVKPDYTSSAPAAVAYWKITGEAEPAVDILVAIVGDTDKPWEGADGIAEIGPAAKDAVDRLTKLLDNTHSVIRSSAAMALAGIGPDAKSAMPVLRKLLDDPEQEVQESAQIAIKAIFRKPTAGNTNNETKDQP